MSFTLTAQQPSFTARTSGNKVAQHSVFEIQFELENGASNDFTPPSFRDFKVVGGPSIGSSTMVVNGAVSQSQSWSYSLLATNQGTFTIGPASVVSGRKKLSTRPVTIVVVAPEKAIPQGSTSTSKDPVILKAELDATNYYPGQQIILTYKILFRENVQTVSTLAEDDYSDFFVQNFGDFSREPTFETVNGQQYTSRILKSLALFAHQSGSYTIEPMRMSVGINAPFPGNQGFFAMRRIQDIEVATQPLTITILPLPQGAPSSYSGAVGQYQIKTIPGNTNITTDDAFTFQLEITGNGDSRRWDPPALVTNGDFETYDPKIIEDKVFENSNTVANIRTVGYQMIPHTPGDYRIYVPFSFFDPARKEYITIGSDTMTVHVVQGQQKPGTVHAEQDVSHEPLQLMKVNTPWLKDRFWVSVPHLVLFALVLIIALYSWWVNRKYYREKQLSDAERSRLEAGKVARSQLDLLEASAQGMESKAFFESASAIYYKFLTDRFTIPSSELDESRIASYLTKGGVPDQPADRARRLFALCLSARYGGTPGGYSQSEMLNECREIIGLLE